MSRRASRLHMIERSLRKPRPARAKSRALTVMRLEGVTAAAATPARPRLPKDLEKQIAVVRGRAVGKPSRGLLELETRLLRAPGLEPAAPAVHRYEHVPGPALPVPSRAPAPPPAPHAQALSVPEPFGESALGGRFAVESFEEPAPAASNGAGGWRQDADVPPVPIPPASAAPVAPEPRVAGNGKRALSENQQAVAADFERDLAAMLGSDATPQTAPEDEQWEETLCGASGAMEAPSAPAAQAEAPPPPTRNAHAVFDQMGLAMNYANGFDLGTVDLPARFDQFDKELAVTPKPAAPAAPQVPVQALALDDFDLVADLAEISGAQSAEAPETAALTQAAPTSLPTPDSEQAAAPAA